MRLLERLLTYSRPPKYPAASRTITTRIARDAGRVLCIIGECMSNGNRCWLSASLGKSTGGRGGSMIRVPDCKVRDGLWRSSTSKISNS